MNKYLKSFKKPIITLLTDKYGKARANEVLEKTSLIYDKFIEETPSIGGRNNIMSHNLYQALVLFAVYEASDHDITENDIQNCIEIMFTNKYKRLGRIININYLTGKRIKKVIYSFCRSYKKKVDRYRGNEWNNTWGIEINPENHKNGLAITLVGCPIADFARKHGYLHLMPYLCNSDYMVAKAIHAQLIRHHTVAEGYETCDYWYLGDKERDFE